MEAAVQAAEEAVTVTDQADAFRAGWFSNLAAIRGVRFERFGEIDDLRAAIRAAGEAVDLTPSNDLNRPTMLLNLGNLLALRFERSGQVADIDLAIEIGRENVEKVGRLDPKRVPLLVSLGDRLRTRFERFGHLVDLDEALRLLQEAAQSPLLLAADQSTVFMNLSVALRARPWRLRTSGDLDAAIQAARQAVDAARGSGELKAPTLINLSLALFDRFKMSGGHADLDDAIRLARDAVETVPPAHAKRAALLVRLAVILRARYNLDRLAVDLDAAVEASAAAVSATPEGHPDRADRLNTLAISLQDRFELTGRHEDLEISIESVKWAAKDPIASPQSRCLAALLWGRATAGTESVTAFTLGIDLLPLVSGQGLTYEDSLDRGQYVAGIGRDAAAAFIANGDAGGALVALEQAGSFAFSQLLQSRTDLEDLRRTQPALHQRIVDALAVLNTESDATKPDGLRALPAPHIALARREASGLLEVALAEVRGLGGVWSRFLLPPEAQDLQRAAVNGPIVVINLSDRRCDALIVTMENVQVVPLNLSNEEARKQATRFLEASSSLFGAVASQQRLTADETLREVCAWMWDAIAEPVLRHLGHLSIGNVTEYESWPRVWWRPTGALSLLPIHAAGYHQPAESDEPNRTVIDRAISSTIPTIAALLASQSRSPLAGTSAMRALMVGMAQTPWLDGQKIADLPGVDIELALLCDRLRATDVTKLFASSSEGTRPTRSAVVDQLPRHAWVHLSCHARTDPVHPTRSTLLLSDHLLEPFTVLDLVHTRAPIGQLMYLSACTTARTGLSNVNEPVHFASAALAAGYRHVVATLWPVFDTTGAEVADSIYSDLTRDGQPVSWTADGAAIAVHRAIRDQRSTPGNTILTWAPFIHLGP